jgi:hypothetical protein
MTYRPIENYGMIGDMAWAVETWNAEPIDRAVDPDQHSISSCPAVVAGVFARSPYAHGATCPRQSQVGLPTGNRRRDLSELRFSVLNVENEPLTAFNLAP